MVYILFCFIFVLCPVPNVLCFSGLSVFLIGPAVVSYIYLRPIVSFSLAQPCKHSVEYVVRRSAKLCPGVSFAKSVVNKWTSGRNEIDYNQCNVSS